MMLVFVTCLGVVIPDVSVAQQRDSSRTGIAAPKPNPPQPARTDTPKPPMSPRRAFLSSLLIPGYAQNVFGRDRAAMLFAVIEVGSIGMARKSAMDLAEAKA